MLVREFEPRALLTKRRESSFFEDLLQLVLEAARWVCWGAWVTSSNLCSLDTGKIHLKTFSEYRLWEMGKEEKKKADYLILKISETLLEAGLWEERSKSKSFYDFVRDRYYHSVDLPRVEVRINGQKNLQKYDFIRIKFSPNEIKKVNSDWLLPQINQCLSLEKSDLVAMEPTLERDGWLKYPVRTAGYDPQIKLKTYDDLAVMLSNGHEFQGKVVSSNTTLPLDYDCTWDMASRYGGLIAGASGTGKTSLLFSLIAFAGFKAIRLFICDGKNDELGAIAAKFLPQDRWAVGTKVPTRIHYLLGISQARYRHLQRMREKQPDLAFAGWQNFKDMPPILLVLDEQSAVVAGLSAKAAKAYQKDLLQLLQTSRAAGIFPLIALQQANAVSLPTAEREQLSGLKVLLGDESQISSQNRTMVFGAGVELSPNPYSGPGVGYVWLDGSSTPEPFKAPQLPKSRKALFKLMSEALNNQKSLSLA